ncbi:hypothetical protein BH683_026675 [Williamsia sp. 1138]|uniref:sigma factor-like helix-turn-helix DNA-binding protein n=1 Tax=Williamsia sp. 1138 TaxID=1903117 RepID=UPI000A1020E7|nr:sigma factor-like helix-turn-helix DNA-binding protein [Williamsia sp. 1138]OZG25752.1 hypothetical protein BH683_026675 [Williamsia sp. 1138]
MSDSKTAAPMSKTAWTMLLPWLDEYRSGPSILASNELIPNAWLDGSPADALNTENFSRFCELVALRHLQDRGDAILADDFPTVGAATALSALALGRHSEKALQDNKIFTVGDILPVSANHLLGLPQVGRATVVDVVAALVAQATRTPQGADDRSGGRILTDPSLAAFIESVDDRDRIILHERIFAAKPRTQSDLAKQMGLSRERVNQIDRTLRLQLSETVGASVDLRRLLAETVALADPLADAAQVAEALPLFATEIPALGVSVGQLLIAGSNDLAGVNGWIMSRPPSQIADLVGEILDSHTGDERLVPIRAVATGLNLSDSEAVRWLTNSGYTVLDDHVVNGPTSTGDLVCGVLSIAGKPRTFDEILSGLAGEPRSRSSVRNALVTDDRIVKTDRTTYGLRRWGGEKYLPVHRQIGRILDDAGGKIEIADLVAQISAKYDVTESSIRAYAGAGEFVMRDDVVSRRSERYVHRKSPAKTRSLYRDGDTIRWATTVGAAHLKGSAFNIPSALAGLVGVGPGNPVKLQSRLGPQSLMWVSVQARVGTIKRFAVDLGLALGDPIFLEFTPGGFDVKRQRQGPSTDPVEAIFTRLGRAPEGTLGRAELVEVLAGSLFLPPDSDSATVIAALRHRKESELEALVSAALS